MCHIQYIYTIYIYIYIYIYEGILYQAIGNLSGKEGALTKGPKTNERTVDETSVKLVKELAH